MPEVNVSMPLVLTGDYLKVIRANDLCSVEDKDEMNKRLGWFVCAYDAIVAYQQAWERTETGSSHHSTKEKKE